MPRTRTFVLGCLVGVTLALPAMLEAQTYRLVLTQLVGTHRYTANELAEGLGLTSNSLVTVAQLQEACQRLKTLNLFQSASCSHHTSADTITFTMSVQEVPGCCLPVVCENCVWFTHDQLMKRLKEEIPFFSTELPTYSSMNDELIRVLKQILSEHNIHADVVYDDFWTRRGWNAFHVMEVSTPVAEVRFVGATKPSPEEMEEASRGLVGEGFSATFLRWYIHSTLGRLYRSRGYLDAEIASPTYEYLGPSNGTHPVRVILPVDEGRQYLFHSLSITGLPKRRVDELLEKWSLQEGTAFDETYVDEFALDEVIPSARSSGIDGAQVEACTTRNDNHTVDVALKVTLPKRHSYKRNDPTQCKILFTFTFPAPSE